MHKFPQTSGIYSITNRVTGLVYIGQTKNFHRRYQKHFRALITNSHENKYLQNAFNKYGQENFEFIIIEDVSLDKIQLTEREQFHMDYYQSWDRSKSYNLYPAANSPLGYKHSEEFRQKISDYQKTKTVSEATRLAMSRAHMGRCITPEGKQSISQARAKHYLLTTPEGELILVSNLKQYCASNNINRNMLSKVVSGRFLTWSGFTGRKATAEEVLIYRNLCL